MDWQHINVSPRQLVLCIGAVLYLYLHNHRSKKLSNSGETQVPNNPDNETTKLLVVTRVHTKSAAQIADPSKVVQFVKQVKGYGGDVLICLGAEDYSFLAHYISDVKQELTDADISMEGVDFLPIAPWGYYVTALNAALSYAQDNGYNRIAYQSLEMEMSKDEVDRMLRWMSLDADTIVIGPELTGHEFSEGTQQLRGRTCPWNTFAIWRVQVLGLLGFPLIGDGVGSDRSKGGVEELSAITLLQKMNPGYKAVLMRFFSTTQECSSDSGNGSSSGSGASSSSRNSRWNTSFNNDPLRQEYHNRKMQSKDERPAAQLKALGIESGCVQHVVDRL